MKKIFFSDLILVLIARASGKWSWYQVERALDLRGIGGRVNSAKIINKLIATGFVNERKISNKNLSIYFTTSKGDEKVNQLIHSYGNEVFDSSKKDPNDYT